MTETKKINLIKIKQDMPDVSITDIKIMIEVAIFRTCASYLTKNNKGGFKKKKIHNIRNILCYKDVTHFFFFNLLL